MVSGTGNILNCIFRKKLQMYILKRKGSIMGLWETPEKASLNLLYDNFIFSYIFP